MDKPAHAINIFEDPVFTVRRPDGTIGRVDFPSLLSGLACSNIHALVRLQPHQRAGVLLTLAFFSAVIAHHAKAEPESPEDWRAGLIGALGREGGRLTAPFTEKAFLQPMLAGDVPAADPVHSPADIDCLFANAGHILKYDDAEIDPEDALLALMSGITRRYVLKGVGGSRASCLFAVPCRPGDLSSEVGALGNAWRAAMRSEIRIEHGLNATPATARDHFIGMAWTVTAKGAASDLLGGNQLAYPSLDLFRPIRLVPGRNGVRIQRLTAATNAVIDKSLLSDGAGLGDPHVGYEKRRRYGPKSPDWESIIKMTAGHENFTRPFILNRQLLDPRATHIRVFGVPTEEGKTLGIFDYLVPLPEHAPSDAAFDAALASKDAIEAGAAVKDALNAASKPVIELLCGSRENAKKATQLKDELMRQFSSVIAAALPAAVLANAPCQDLRAIARTSGARALGAFLGRLGGRLLAMATAIERAKLTYAIELKKAWKEDWIDMSAFKDDNTQIATSAFRLQDAILKSDDRDDLGRTIDGRPPLCFYKALAEAGLTNLADSNETTTIAARLARLVARSATRGSASMPFGAALHVAGISEARIQILLSAAGEPLIAAVENAAAMIATAAATRRSSIDWSAPLALVLADIAVDDAAKLSAGRRIARDWALAATH